jgi:hypothetical protein
LRFQSLQDAKEILFGSSIIIVPLVLYAIYVNTIPILDVRVADLLEVIAYLVMALTIVGLGFAAIGVRRLIRDQKANPAQGTVKVVAQVLDDFRYRTVMAAAIFAYGLVFAIVSGIIVYRPLENFGTEYLVSIPSAIIAVCCGNPGFIPVLTVYLTNHVGLLLIPADIVILAVISGMVGLNVALITYQYENRPSRSSIRWFLGVGAACGLFTACPTCAGLLLSATFLSLSSSALVLLSGLQPFLILVTVLALGAGTVLTAKALPLNSESCH